MAAIAHKNVLYVKKDGFRRKIGKAHVKATTSIPTAEDCVRSARARTINEAVTGRENFDVVTAVYIGEHTEPTETRIKRLFRGVADMGSPEVFNFLSAEDAHDFDETVGGLIDSAIRLLDLPTRDWSVACQFEDPDHIADAIVARFADVLVDPTKRVLLPFCGRVALKRACDRAGIYATNVLCVDHDKWFAPFAEDIGDFLLRDLTKETEWTRITREFGPFDLIIGNPPFTVGGDNKFYRTVLKMIAKGLSEDGDVAWISPAKTAWWMLTNSPGGLGIVDASDEFKFENARMDSKCFFMRKGVTTQAPLSQPQPLNVEVHKQWKEVTERDAILDQPHFFCSQAPYRYIVSDEPSNGYYAVTGPDVEAARERLESDWALNTFLPSLNEEKDDRRLNMTLLRWLLNGR